MRDDKDPKGQQPGEPEGFRRNFWIVGGIGVLVAALIMSLASNLGPADAQEVKFSDFTEQLEKGEIGNVVVNEKEASLLYTLEKGDAKNAQVFKVSVSQAPGTIQPLLEQSGVEYSFAKGGKDNGAAGILLVIGIVALIGLIILYSRNRDRDGANSKAPGRTLQAGEIDVTFEDVAGCDEVVEELQEIREFLEDPQRFRDLGANIPKGVLLFGPPGTGKTLLARAVAGEANVPFFSISGSDFVEMYVGVGASRVRKLFEQAKAQAPCVVFIDEIDAVGRRRSGNAQGGQEERENTLNQLLVEIDGFQPNENVIVMAASNRADILDPALTRPGRFDRQIVVDTPDRKGRREILEVHGKDKPFGEDVDLDAIAAQTAGFCGADLANLVNESALLAARAGRKRILKRDVEEATMRVLAGPQKNRIMSEREKKVTAVHEMGHAIVANLSEGAEPVHKVTIVGRGRALGLTVMLPEDDKLLRTRDELMAQMAVALGGRIAEELVFGETTTGAHNDLQKVNAMAQSMVLELGMGRDFALRAFTHQEQLTVHSQELAKRIDTEIDAIVDEAQERARHILRDHQDLLESLGEVLVVRETIDRAEFEQLMAGLDPAELPPVIAEEDLKAEETRNRFTDPLNPAPDAWRATRELDLRLVDSDDRAA